MIFLKYISDAFEQRQQEVKEQLQDPEHEYFLDPELFDSTEEYERVFAEELEERDYYREKNVFWVPTLARWKTIQDNAKLSPGEDIEINNGETTTYKFRSLGKLIDDALQAVENENPKLKRILNKTINNSNFPAKA